jgi:hypothetical protein
MTAAALYIGSFTGSFTECAAVVAAFLCPAVTGRMGTFLIASHRHLRALDSRGGLNPSNCFQRADFDPTTLLPGFKTGFRQLHTFRALEQAPAKWLALDDVSQK